MKRILDCGPADFARMDGEDLVESVRRSEGRTLLCEILWPAPPLVDGVSNAAIAVAFGADLVLLNKFDGDDLAGVKAGLGRPVGVNVEPSPAVPAHRRADRENLERLAGADFVVITANPDAEVDTLAMISASETVREVLPGTPVFVGKMHGSGRRGLAGVDEISRLAEASDAVLIPAPGTVPGSREGRVAGLADAVREAAPSWSPPSGPRRRARTRRRCASWHWPPSGAGQTSCTWGMPESRGCPSRRTCSPRPWRSGAGGIPIAAWR